MAKVNLHFEKKQLYFKRLAHGQHKEILQFCKPQEKADQFLSGAVQFKNH